MKILIKKFKKISIYLGDLNSTLKFVKDKKEKLYIRKEINSSIKSLELIIKECSNNLSFNCSDEFFEKIINLKEEAKGFKKDLTSFLKK